MIIINKTKNIKEQFEKEGLAYPILKTSKKWGLRGSSLLDRETEQSCLNAYIEYLEEKNIIKIILKGGKCL